MAIGHSKVLTNPARFFLVPASSRQRQYEALRAYFVEERPSAQVARAFGYSPGAFRVLCHQFRHQPRAREFFRSTAVGRPPGVRRFEPVREEVIALRKQNYSVQDISAALAERGVRVTPTAARDILREEGFAPLPRRLDEERPAHLGPAVQPIADVRGFSLAPREFVTACGGLFLFVPDLVRLAVPDLATAAALPGSKPIPAPHALLASLVERHYVAMRSRRQPSILAFLAQDPTANVFCYANADLRKGEEAEEVFRFLDFWTEHHGRQLPGELVFDSKLTTHAGLARLDALGVPFITLRRRDARLLAEARALPPSAWRVVALEHVTRKFRTPRVFEQPVTIAQHSFRQLFIEDLGHDEPTILLTNQRTRPVKQLITRYAQRMLIENALSDAVRFFHANALSSSVAMKVDFDLALLVIASGLYRRVARCMRGYSEAQARQIFRDLLDMPATVKVTPTQVRVCFHRRAHLPILLASQIFAETPAVPWWNGASLTFTTDLSG